MMPPRKIANVFAALLMILILRQGAKLSRSASQK